MTTLFGARTIRLPQVFRVRDRVRVLVLARVRNRDMVSVSVRVSVMYSLWKSVFFVW